MYLVPTHAEDGTKTQYIINSCVWQSPPINSQTVCTLAGCSVGIRNLNLWDGRLTRILWNPFIDNLGVNTFMRFASFVHVNIYMFSAYTHIHTHTYTHKYKHEYTHIYKHTQTHIHIFAPTYIHILAYTHTYIHILAHTHTHILAHPHIHTCKHTRSHTHSHIDIHKSITKISAQKEITD